MNDYELEEQVEPEQFVAEETNTKPSKEVYKQLKEQKKYEKYNQKEAAKHRAKFHRVNNVNCYECDNCGKMFVHDKEGTLMYKAKGEYAYCDKCLKELYPNYRHIKLAGQLSKADMLSNHWDTQYFNGLH